MAGFDGGGRCYRCRRAEDEQRAVDCGAYLTGEQRQLLIAMANGGSAFDEAVAAVESDADTVMRAAAEDGELRAALEGRPVNAQRAALLGDYLAAFCYGIADRPAAHQAVRRSAQSILGELHPRFTEVEQLLTGLLRDIAPVVPRYRPSPLLIARVIESLDEGTPIKTTCARYNITPSALERARADHPGLDAAMAAAGQRRAAPVPGPDVLDRAARLLEEGSTINEAAKETGLNPQMLRRFGAEHPRLQVAMKAAAQRHRRRSFDAEMFDRAAAMIEEGGKIRPTARALGISYETLFRYRLDHPRLDQAITAALRRSYPRKFDFTRLDEVARLIEEGASIRQASKETGVVIETIRRYRGEHPRLDAALDAAAERPRRRIEALDVIEEAVRLIGEGHSVKATAAALGVPKSRLDRARKTHSGLDAAMSEAVQRYRNRGWNPELFDQAADLLESGTPILTVAKQLHLGTETMHHHRKAHPRLDAALRAVEDRRSQRTSD